MTDTIEKKDKDFIIATGSSSNHFKSLKQLIRSFLDVYPEDDCRNQMIVFDLGLKKEQWLELTKDLGSPKIVYRKFEFEKYPDYFAIEKNAGEYAWKPAIIHSLITEISTKTQPEILFWMDAGNKLVEKMDVIIEFIRKNKIYSDRSAGNIIDWTHPATLRYMGIGNDTDLLNEGNCNGACYGFYLDQQWVHDFIREFYELAITKECIAPDGSSRDNHRQDQSVFSILFVKYQRIYGFERSNCFDLKRWCYPGYAVHQDCD
jgi:hypothetical protein